MYNPFKTIYAAYDKMGKPSLCNPFKRRVTIVYSSHWLFGVYAFTFKAGAPDLLDQWQSSFVSNLPDSMTAADIAAARQNPMINIEDIF